MGLGDRCLYWELFRTHADLRAELVDGNGRVAIGGDPIDLVACVFVGLELIVAWEFIPLYGLGFIGVHGGHTELDAIRFAGGSAGLDLKQPRSTGLGTLIDGETASPRRNLHLGTQFLSLRAWRQGYNTER